MCLDIVGLILRTSRWCSIALRHWLLLWRIEESLYFPLDRWLDFSAGCLRNSLFTFESLLNLCIRTASNFWWCDLLILRFHSSFFYIKSSIVITEFSFMFELLYSLFVECQLYIWFSFQTRNLWQLPSVTLNIKYWNCLFPVLIWEWQLG